MSAQVIDGREIAKSIEKEVRRDVKAFVGENGVTPKLVVLLVGDDPASHVYVRRKSQACERAGILEETRLYPATTGEAEFLAEIRSLNADAQVHGILVQMPLPRQISPGAVLDVLDYRKDVDGFHPYNVGRAAVGDPLFQPCTPSGVVEMLLRSGHSPDGKHVVIVGRSNVVGKPLMNMLVQKTPNGNATLTVCHTGTPDIGEHTRRGEIVIVAAGRAEIVRGDMLRPGCAVIDVGVNRVDDPSAEKGYRIVGDVHFASAVEVVGAISPVPGGVGPMTVAMLLKNTLRAARLAHR